MIESYDDSVRGNVVLVIAAVALGGCSGSEAVATTTVGPGSKSTTSVPSSSTSWPDDLPTAEEIMADGEVTDEERELARRAVFECVVAAGADTTFELFDVDPSVRQHHFEEYSACLGEYPGLPRMNEGPNDRFALDLLGVVECTEDRTGRYYGPKTVDEIGRLTPKSRATIDKALQNDRPDYEACYLETHDVDAAAVFGEIIEYRFDSGDQRRISLRIENCGYIYGGYLIEETPTTVTVDAVSRGEGLGHSCWLRHPLILKDPLGDRIIINETTGQPISQETT